MPHHVNRGSFTSLTVRALLDKRWSKRRQQWNEAEQRCSKCKTIKSIERFPIDKRHTPHRASICRKCQYSFHKKWKNNNREAFNARRRAKYAKLTKEERRAQRDKKKDAASYRRWATKNRGSLRAKQRLREARRLEEIRNLPIEQQNQIARFYEFVASSRRVKCYWCKRAIPRGKRHVDHIIPLVAGGSVRASNLCGSCAFCNLSKRGLDPLEFSGQGELRFP